MKNATLIYNPIAGRQPARREKQVRDIVQVLAGQSIHARLAPTAAPGTATELARAAVAQGDDLVLVCGGDGTLNEVINGMALSHTPLGLLPGGTANLAAKELRVPHNPVRAAREILAWRPRRVALGVASFSGSRRYFLSVGGIGFDAYVVHSLSPSFKKSAGVAAYILEAIRQVWRYPIPHFHCRVAGREFQATFASAQRARRYAGWFHMAPGASLFQDGLRLCVFKNTGRARYMLYAAALIARQHLRLSDVELVNARKIQCVPEGASRIYFELDGELAGQLPATFEVVPDALTLLVP